MVQSIHLATCNLNQWALDFEGNLIRTIESIRIAKERGAIYRLGPELELCGYSCGDHFLEEDLYLHCWDSLMTLLCHPDLTGIVCDVGMPLSYKHVRYNCRVIFYNHKILLIRPKKFLANDGNYRETRWFSPWSFHKKVVEMALPDKMASAINQDTTQFGDGIISAKDVSFGTELCEELFTPRSPHISLSLNGVEVFTNGSASHHELRKLSKRIQMIQSATAKVGGIYLYANQKGKMLKNHAKNHSILKDFWMEGCDGERLYFDGCAMIVVNGNVVAQGSQFSLKDVEVVDATVDLDQVRSFRGYLCSRSLQASAEEPFPKILINNSLIQTTALQYKSGLSASIQPRIFSPEEEIALGPACYLWDYLRRSKSAGFFLPLSGGIDSCSTALIVHMMCRLVVMACREGDSIVISDCKKLIGDEDYLPQTDTELCSKLLSTCYMGSDNSSAETKERADLIAQAIGSSHLFLNINTVVKAFISIVSLVLGKTPSFKSNGGTEIENLALQNIQARTRMVFSYLFAQLLPWANGKKGSLLVLGSANVDECLRGYLTKYDCSSADINPIGGISKKDLKKFVSYYKCYLPSDILEKFLEAKPTAELEPITSEYTQNDEDDMGLSYEELSHFGYIRKVERCGPYGMYQQLVLQWRKSHSPLQVALKVKRFFYFYAVNRHKMTVLTPSYHAENYSPEDNRFDLRPFLYNARWTSQFRAIEALCLNLSEID